MTYSIVARDASGNIGVAVASHAFAVGRDVVFVRAGVGAVATQGIPVPGSGDRLLDALAEGTTASAALQDLIERDRGSEIRQTALIGTTGPAAVHTGVDCIAHAGHTEGDDYAAQANFMAERRSWNALSEAFLSTPGPLEDRLIAALQAGLAAGGDVRGQQAAALLVASAQPGTAVTTDLRVDDHPEPLQELQRLRALDRADRRMRTVLEASLTGSIDARSAVDELHRAQAAFPPGNAEPQFWAAVIGERSGLPAAYPIDPRWQAVSARLNVPPRADDRPHPSLTTPGADL